MTDTMKDLIERLESSTEGSRELDAGIFVALGGYPKIWPFAEGSNHDKPVSHYTTSIDAALTLFGDDLVSWRVGDSPGGPGAWVLLADGTEAEGLPLPGKGTPAICIVLAALQASTEAGT